MVNKVFKRQKKVRVTVEKRRNPKEKYILGDYWLSN